MKDLLASIEKFDGLRKRIGPTLNDTVAFEVLRRMVQHLKRAETTINIRLTRSEGTGTTQDLIDDLRRVAMEERFDHQLTRVDANRKKWSKEEQAAYALGAKSGKKGDKGYGKGGGKKGAKGGKGAAAAAKGKGAQTS